MLPHARWSHARSAFPPSSPLHPVPPTAVLLPFPCACETYLRKRRRFLRQIGCGHSWASSLWGLWWSPSCSLMRGGMEQLYHCPRARWSSARIRRPTTARPEKESTSIAFSGRSTGQIYRYSLGVSRSVERQYRVPCIPSPSSFESHPHHSIEDSYVATWGLMCAIGPTSPSSSSSSPPEESHRGRGCYRPPSWAQAAEPYVRLRETTYKVRPDGRSGSPNIPAPPPSSYSKRSYISPGG